MQPTTPTAVVPKTPEPTFPTVPAANPILPETTATYPPIAGPGAAPLLPADRPMGFTKPAAADSLAPPATAFGPPMPVAGPANPLVPVPAAPRTSNAEVRTSFDVDLHRVEDNETYETISRKQYGDAKYAEALRRFNGNRALTKGGEIELPPTGELRKRMSSLVPIPAVAVPMRPTTPDGWTAPATKPVSTPSYYTVPRDGMSFWDIAEEAVGDRKDAAKVRELNAKFDANIRFKKGDQVRLPGKS